MLTGSHGRRATERRVREKICRKVNTRRVDFILFNIMVSSGWHCDACQSADSDMITLKAHQAKNKNVDRVS